MVDTLCDRLEYYQGDGAVVCVAATKLDYLLDRLSPAPLHSAEGDERDAHAQLVDYLACVQSNSSWCGIVTATVCARDFDYHLEQVVADFKYLCIRFELVKLAV